MSPDTHNSDRAIPCRHCDDEPMSLASVTPRVGPYPELHTFFQCVRCGHVETIEVN